MKHLRKKVFAAVLSSALVLGQLVPAMAEVSFKGNADQWSAITGSILTETERNGIVDVNIYTVSGVNYALIDLGRDADFGNSSIEYKAYDRSAGKIETKNKDDVTAVSTDKTVVKMLLKDQDETTTQKEINITSKNAKGEEIDRYSITFKTFVDSQAVPKTVYGKTFMYFSEFNKDNATTSSGTTIDLAAKGTTVDTAGISSAEYELDANYHVPTGKYETYNKFKATNGTWGASDLNEIKGINDVDVQIPFDLYANAMLLELTGLKTPTARDLYNKINTIKPTYILNAFGQYVGINGNTLVDNNTMPNIYKAKVLLSNGTYGGRVTVNANAAEKVIGPADSKVIGVGDELTVTPVYYADDLAQVTIGFGNLKLKYETPGAFWDNFTNNIYGGFVKDSKGNVQPLNFLENIYTFKGAVDIAVAFAPKSVGDHTVTLFVEGYEDITFTLTDVKMAPPSSEVVINPVVEATVGQTEAIAFEINMTNKDHFNEVKISDVKVFKDDFDCTDYVTVTKNTTKVETVAGQRDYLTVVIDKDVFAEEGFDGDYLIVLPQYTNTKAQKQLYPLLPETYPTVFAEKNGVFGTVVYVVTIDDVTEAAE